MNSINYFNQTEEVVSDLDTIKKVIDFAIKYENLDDVEFNIIFVDNEQIHEINREYRNIDRPTDVITFALEDNKDFPSLGTHRILGDIYISLERAKEQSVEYNHSYLRELSFLAVHGFLHLLGYDHMDPEDEKVMFGKQEEILNEFGITR